MTTRKARFLMSLAEVLIVAGAIFLFSAQDGADSSELSSGVTRWLLSVFRPGFRQLGEAEQRALLEVWGFYVRKAAHFSEYAALGQALTFLLTHLRRRWRLPAACAAAWLLAALYACADEWHQSFVDARGPALKDVGIDSAGALTGILLAAAFIVWFRRRETARGLPRG